MIIKTTLPFSPSHITKRKGKLDFYHTMIKMIIVTITTCTEVSTVSKEEKEISRVHEQCSHVFFILHVLS
jgi:hypothetical protein